MMFNEAPVNGKPYSFGMWKEYAVHDDKQIKGFFGDYRFLSNFELTYIDFEGRIYPSTENAFQACKTLDSDLREPFTKMTPAEAKKAGSKLPLRGDWEHVKTDTMLAVCFDKFYRNRFLRERLLNTGDRYLEETNHWGDKTWGADYKTGIGENRLGKILMKLRTVFK
jgi:ribA/ribD-fused uncharacterized protein